MTTSNNIASLNLIPSLICSQASDPPHHQPSLTAVLSHSKTCTLLSSIVGVPIEYYVGVMKFGMLRLCSSISLSIYLFIYLFCFALLSLLQRLCDYTRHVIIISIVSPSGCVWLGSGGGGGGEGLAVYMHSRLPHRQLYYLMRWLPSLHDHEPRLFSKKVVNYKCIHEAFSVTYTNNIKCSFCLSLALSFSLAYTITYFNNN